MRNGPFFTIPFVTMVLISCTGRSETPVTAGTLADQLLVTMGGRDLFSQYRYLRFDFVVRKDQKEVARHRHLWDRRNGRYRIQGNTKDGTPYAVLFKDISLKDGQVWIGDSLISDGRQSEFLEYGYGRFINDTYWLLMPWKIEDPGVHLSMAQPAVVSSSGSIHNVLHLSFDSVGLTPKDQYWIFINTNTGLIDRWTYILDGDSARTGDFAWESWRSYEGIWLSGRKVSQDRKTEIVQDNIQLLKAVNEEVFTKVSTPLP